MAELEWIGTYTEVPTRGYRVSRGPLASIGVSLCSAVTLFYGGRMGMLHVRAMPENMNFMMDSLASMSDELSCEPADAKAITSVGRDKELVYDCLERAGIPLLDSHEHKTDSWGFFPSRDIIALPPEGMVTIYTEYGRIEKSFT